MTIPTLRIGKTPNYASVTIGTLRLEYSYQTVIAFDTPETGLVVRQNDWGPTTGKHLNLVDGGSREAQKRRFDSDTFDRMLELVIAEHWAPSLTKEVTH